MSASDEYISQIRRVAEGVLIDRGPRPADVTAVSPLTVRMFGDTADLEVENWSGETLATNDRVLVTRAGAQWIITAVQP